MAKIGDTGNQLLFEMRTADKAVAERLRRLTTPTMPESFSGHQLNNMKAKSKPNTRLAGASDERDAVLAYIRRRIRQCEKFKHVYPESVTELIKPELERIEKWLLGRAKRYGKAKGGLGK